MIHTLSDFIPEWADYNCVPPCNKKLCRYLPIGKHAFEIKCNHCSNTNYRGNVITRNLVELRCTGIHTKKINKINQEAVCNKLLARILPGTVIERKCPRCGTIIRSQSPIDKVLDNDA